MENNCNKCSGCNGISKSRTTIYCDNRECAYNDSFSCIADHIQLKGKGQCTTFLSREESQRKEIEVRCQPFNQEAPLFLIARTKVKHITEELAELGFRYMQEPVTGMFVGLQRKNIDSYVWVLQTDFKKAEELIAKLKSRKYTVQNFISSEEQSIWERQRQYSSMTNAEKEEMLKKLIPPKMPDVLKGGYWNGKIYGSPGRKSIYIDNQKRAINESQISEIRKYIADKKEYDAQYSDLLRAM